ncbi:MAG: hypothetical protein ACO3ND_03640, partial [Opitutales bacterium]
MRLVLVVGGPLQRGLVQPDVRYVQAQEDAVGAGFPGEAELERLSVQRLLSLGDQVGDAQEFA